MLLCVTVIIPFVLEILFKVPAADAEGFFFFHFLEAETQMVLLGTYATEHGASLTHSY